MKNTIKVSGYNAVVVYDAETDQLRGEFIGLNSGVDFYADNIKDLHKEAQRSLNVFLEVCKEQGIEPVKQFSGKFNVRIPPELHEKLVVASTAQGKSLNDLVRQALEHVVEYS